MTVGRAVGIDSLKSLRLGEEVARRASPLCSRFEHPRAHDAQSRVLIVSDANQRVERLILEHRPPVFQMAGLHLLIAHLYPLGRYGSRRLAVIGTDLKTIANPLPQSCRNASAAAKNGTDQREQGEPARQDRPSHPASIWLELGPTSHRSFPPWLFVLCLRQIRNNPHRRKYRPGLRRILNKS